MNNSFKDNFFRGGLLCFNHDILLIWCLSLFLSLSNASLLIFQKRDIIMELYYIPTKSAKQKLFSMTGTCLSGNNLQLWIP